MDEMDSIMANMGDYIPHWHKDGTLAWKLIGEPVGNKGQKRKPRIYNQIDINKITVLDNIEVNDEMMALCEKYKEQTGKYLPVALNRDFGLVYGYESYLLAKKKGRKKIPFERLDIPTQKLLRNTVLHKPYGNRKYCIATNGEPVYVSSNKYKKVRECKRKCTKLNWTLTVTPKFRFIIADSTGKTVYGGENGARLSTTISFLKNRANTMTYE